MSDILVTDGSEEDGVSEDVVDVASEDVETADGDGSIEDTSLFADADTTTDASSDVMPEHDVAADSSLAEDVAIRDAEADVADAGPDVTDAVDVVEVIVSDGAADAIVVDAGDGVVTVEYTHPTGRIIQQLWAFFIPPGSPVDPVGLMLLPALCVGGFIPGPRVSCTFINTVPPGSGIRVNFSYSSTYPAWDEEANWVCNRTGGSLSTACPGNPEAYRFFYNGALLPNPTPMYFWGTQSDPMRPDGMGGMAQTNYIHRLLP